MAAGRYSYLSEKPEKVPLTHQYRSHLHIDGDAFQSNLRLTGNTAISPGFSYGGYYTHTTILNLQKEEWIHTYSWEVMNGVAGCSRLARKQLYLVYF